MSETEELLTTFYQAFQKRDHQTMSRCYHKDVVFSDPVFPRLEGWKASAMWRMLCERGKDLAIEFGDIEADETQGSAFWKADYTFSQTGQRVHNEIRAKFVFQDGLILSHHDSFDLGKWMGMALGWKGKLLGWLPPVQKAMQKKASKSLDHFIAKNKLGRADFT